MIAKEVLLLFVFCGVEFTSATSEQWEKRTQCRNQKVICPCKDRRGVGGHVLVVTCNDQKDPKIPVCRGKALYSEECGKVYFSSKRHRRDTGNCDNGIIPGSPHPSDDADPYISMTSGSTITRDVDGSHRFKCNVYSNFAANVTWLINGILISLDSKLKREKYKFGSCKRSLHVTQILEEDAGNYTCVVTNEKGKSYSATAKLIVKVPSGPVIEYAKLDGLDTAYIGTTVNITCKIQGFDGVIGYFLKNDMMVMEDDELQKYEYFKPRVIVTPPNYVFHLEIKNVTMEDAGNYTCKASKYGLKSTKTFLLEVELTATSQAVTKIATTNMAATSQDVSQIVMIGIACAFFIIIVVVPLSLFIAKKKRWLWFSSSRHSHNPKCFPCQPMLDENGDIENAECAEVLKQLPEIDYEPRHDVFICYCYKDVGWVKELHAELEKRGFECCIDFKTFAIGVPIVQNITEAICYSKKTIAVLSPDFIKSEWCTHELHKALSRVRYHQVVPVMYKNCEIPFALQDTTYLDWENCNVKPYFWEQLEKALRKPNGEAYNRSHPQNGNQSSTVSSSL
ncbi:uncharacterized protein LOC113676771 isoform X5 [Pocillopora damicornis]|uniref:uncharacterized protein LOC113676771 isoform X5 n=1 Tax=Pocillopora damicornis TaxID=46731 RepID=UPI000F550B0C|nr:uncharacterized protein LOC113676771 isoform X5 [Pocillopora damicornis]